VLSLLVAVAAPVGDFGTPAVDTVIQSCLMSHPTHVKDTLELHAAHCLNSVWYTA